jgi:Uma2 family endonuclease
MSVMPAIRIRRWKRVEYDRMIECGIFQPDERLELLDGVLVVKEQQTPPRAAGIRRVADALRGTFESGWLVDTHTPIALDRSSEPEPDVSIVRGTIEDYETRHPDKPALLVQVALKRLGFDRLRKGGLYARARVPEYWIVNLVGHVLEVHRDPRRSKAARYGWRYADVQVLGPDAIVTPLAARGSSIPVAELLPGVRA